MAQGEDRPQEPGVGRFQVTVPWFGTRIGFFVTLGIRRTITSYQIAGVENKSTGTLGTGQETVQSGAPGTVGPGRLPPPPPPPPMVYQIHSALVFEMGLMRERSGGSPGTTGPQGFPPPPPDPP